MFRADQPVDIKDVIAAPNIAKLMDIDDVRRLGNVVMEAFNADYASSEARMTKIAEAEKAAMMLCEQKSFPWENASNVKMPIVQLAALQFHSRAFPTLVSPPDMVRCEVDVPDPEGEHAARANRISKHMSYQLMHKVRGWLSEQDRLLLMIPIIGCAVKKVFFDVNTNRPESVLIRPSQFVVSYYTTDLTLAERASHFYPITANTIISRIRQGVFLENDDAPYDSEEFVRNVAGGGISTAETQVKDDKQGTQANVHDNTPTAIEMHCWLDLDGDNFCEPYIVTVDKDTGWVWRIRARFTNKDIKWTGEEFTSDIIHIEPEVNFIKYPFIPSPDGGFYDLGFYDLLGPVNETVNTLINQLLDNGTLNLTKGGFLGKGARVRGGDYKFRPFEWKRLDSIAARLDDVIFPLPVGEPSPVLLQLLGMLIEYCERVAGSTENMTGISPGQNTPAETSRNVMEQGLKIYSAIYLRVYLAMAQEYKALFAQNVLFLKTKGEPYVNIDDYDLAIGAVNPAADPAVVSDAMRMQQAMALINGLQMGVPYDGAALGVMLAKALKIRNPEQLFPKEPPQPQPDPTKVEVAKIAADQKEKEGQRVHEREMLRLIQEVLPKVQAEIEMMHSKSKEHEAAAIFKTAEAHAAVVGTEVATNSTKVEAARVRYDNLIRVAELLQQIAESDREDTSEEPTNDSKQGAARRVASSSIDAADAGLNPVTAGIRQGAIERGGLADVINPVSRYDGNGDAS